MKKILLSLPQLDWSCFLASYINNCLFDVLGNNFSLDLIEKNTIDSSTFPYIVGNIRPMGINEIGKSYDLVFNLDSDPIVKKFMSYKYPKSDFSHCMGPFSENISLWDFLSCQIKTISDNNDRSEKVSFNINFVNKVKKDRSESGVAIKNDLLRMYVKNAFFADNDRLWHIPIRSNLVKRYSECNAVKSIVTDDIFCALAGYSLGKDVIFLKTHDVFPNISIEKMLHVQDVSDFINAVSS
jgi:hypothetical protein